MSIQSALLLEEKVPKGSLPRHTIVMTGDEVEKRRGMDRRSSIPDSYQDETEEDKGTRRWGDKGKMKSEK
jgi:hypothetical protein